jgi:transcriptional regulator with XRE-family HTH domain
MAIVNKLKFTKKQLKGFAKLFYNARVSAKLTQLQVAQEAFSYKVSHCKVSRIERVAMPKVDATAIARMAQVFGIPQSMLEVIDKDFVARVAVTQTASKKGFWAYPAELI